MPRAHPNLWQLPQWHPDWDGDFTFAALRTVALALLEHTDLDPRLAIVCDGYAHLDVYSGPTRTGIAHVNRAIADSSIPEFSLYAGAENDELTTTDLAAAIRFLNERRTAFPENPEDND